MKINPNDAKWTAYVLGELDGEDRAAIERLLESSDEARALVEELRIATTVLKDELTVPMVATLNAHQRSAIHAAASRKVRTWSGTRMAAWATGLAAAGLILVTVITPSLRSRQAANSSDTFSAAPAVDITELKSQPQPLGGSPIRAEKAAPEAAAEATKKATGEATAEPTGGVSRTPILPPASMPNEGSGQTAGSVQDATAAVPPGTDITVAATDTVVAQDKSAPAINPKEEIGQVREQVQVQENAADPKLQAGKVRERAEDQANTAPANSRRSGLLSGVLGGMFGASRAVSEPPPVVLDRSDRPRFNTEAYDGITDNPFIRVTQDPLATFSIDVDTASYANVRRFISQNQLPPKDAVRIEEMINYFSYDYAQPAGQQPIAAQMEVASAPWNPQHRLVRIGIKGKDLDLNRRPSSNLVFLIDVSGSMQPAEKLPLLKNAMKLLVDKLTENDRVSMIVYAGASGMVLPPTTGDRKGVILRALENLEAGGSTNGASGIQLAYNLAVSNYIRGGINRVILATDGDFNVGMTNQGDLIRLIEEKAKSGVFLSVLGFGIGNLKDSTLEKLADTGNGNYAYIDTLNEARKVLVEQMGGTLVTVAKDVKIQIEFNPAQVNAYRLIGYENRVLRNEDFNNDQKDAGDMGAGHTVTALFEVVPPGVDIAVPGVDPLKYQTSAAPSRSSTRETLTLKVRYKDPEGSQSKLMEVPLVDAGRPFSAASADYRFAASVAAFGMILRDSPYRGNVSISAVLDMAEGSKGPDRSGYRQEFIGLVSRARSLNETAFPDRRRIR